MAIALTLPALALLFSFPGLPGFGHLPDFHRHPKAPQDTLPPVWKSVSQLALEDSLVLTTLPPIGPQPTSLTIETYNDPRSMSSRSAELCRIAWPTPCPCCGPHCRVRKISMSSVP